MDFKEEDVQKLFEKNRRTFGEHQFTVPSPGTYPYQWLWDSCFHAIILSHFDPEAAKKEIKSLFVKQFPDGMIPHIIFWKKYLGRPYYLAWESRETSAITQPPMLAYAVWEMHRKNPDKDFLNEIYEPMLRFYQYLIERRDPRDHHLVGIINPDESGEDNSPRFDRPMSLKHSISFFGHMYERNKLVEANRKCDFNEEICLSKNFWVKDVPFNVIVIRNLQALGHIASLLGHKQGEHFATVNAELMRDAMRTRMFEDGVFWSTSGPEYEKLKVATWAHFMPMFADLYTKEEADKVMEMYFRNDRSFRSNFGIRTVSREEKSYRPKGFWRGSVWMGPHWFIYKGLRSYGYKEDAAFIKRASTACIERNGFREYFDPETGKGLGAKDFTWGGLILDMEEGEEVDES